MIKPAFAGRFFIPIILQNIECYFLTKKVYHKAKIHYNVHIKERKEEEVYVIVCIYNFNVYRVRQTFNFCNQSDLEYF